MSQSELKDLFRCRGSKMKNFTRAFKRVEKLLNETDVNTSELMSKLIDFKFYFECLDKCQSRIIEHLKNTTECETERRIARNYQDMAEQLQTKANKIINASENSDVEIVYNMNGTRSSVHLFTDRSEPDTSEVESLETQDLIKKSETMSSVPPFTVKSEPGTHEVKNLATQEHIRIRISKITGSVPFIVRSEPDTSEFESYETQDHSSNSETISSVQPFTIKSEPDTNEVEIFENSETNSSVQPFTIKSEPDTHEVEIFENSETNSSVQPFTIKSEPDTHEVEIFENSETNSSVQPFTIKSEPGTHEVEILETQDHIKNSETTTLVQPFTIKSEPDSSEVESLEAEDPIRNSSVDSNTEKLTDIRIMVQNFISRYTFVNRDEDISRKVQAQSLGNELNLNGYFQNPLEWLIQRRYIRHTIRCPKCSGKTRLRRHYSDNKITHFYFCYDSLCMYKEEFKIPSFFPFGEKFVTTMTLIFHWVVQSSYDDLSRDIPIHDFIVVSVYQKLQKVCAMFQDTNSFQLGTNSRKHNKSFVEVAFFRYADALILGAMERNYEALCRTRIHVFPLKIKLYITDIQEILRKWLAIGSRVIVNRDQPLIHRCLDGNVKIMLADRRIKDVNANGLHTLTLSNYVISHLKKLSQNFSMNEMNPELLQVYFNEMAFREHNENCITKEFYSILDNIFAVKLSYFSAKDLMKDASHLKNDISGVSENGTTASDASRGYSVFIHPLTSEENLLALRVAVKDTNFYDIRRSFTGVTENGIASDTSQRFHDSNATQVPQMMIASQMLTSVPDIYEISSNSCSNDDSNLKSCLINSATIVSDSVVNSGEILSSQHGISSDLSEASSLQPVEMEESMETEVDVNPVIQAAEQQINLTAGSLLNSVETEKPMETEVDVYPVILEQAAEQTANAYPVQLVENFKGGEVVDNGPQSSEEILPLVLQEPVVEGGDCYNNDLDENESSSCEDASSVLNHSTGSPKITQEKQSFPRIMVAGQVVNKNSSIFSMQKFIYSVPTGSVKVDVDSLFSIRFHIPPEAESKNGAYTLRDQLREQNFMTLLPWWLVQNQLIPLNPPCEDCNGKFFYLKSCDVNQDKLCWLCDTCRKEYPLKRPKLFQEFESFLLEDLLLCTYHWACKSSLWAIRYDISDSSRRILNYFDKLQTLCGLGMSKKKFNGIDENRKACIEASVVKLGDLFILCAFDRYRKVSRLKAISSEEASNTTKYLEILEEWLGNDCMLFTEQKISDSYLLGVTKVCAKIFIIGGRPVVPSLHNVNTYLRKLMDQLFRNLRHDQLSIETVQRILDEVQWRERYGQTEDAAFWNILNEMNQYNKSFEENSGDRDCTVAVLGEIKKDRHYYISDRCFHQRWAPTTTEARSLLTSLPDTVTFGKIKQHPISVPVSETDKEIPIIPLPISFKDLLSIKMLFKNDAQCHQTKAEKLGDLLKEEGYLKDPIKWVFRQKLMKSEITCNVCDFEMRLRKIPEFPEGVGWLCRNSGCGTMKEFKSPSFFNLGCSLRVVFAIIYHWAVQSDYNTLTSAVPLNDTTIIGIYQKLQRLCSNNLKTSPFKLGGQKNLVEVVVVKFANCFVLGAMERNSSSNTWIQKRLRFHVFSPGTTLSLSVIEDVLKSWVEPRTKVILNFQQSGKSCVNGTIRFRYADETVADVNSKRYHTLTITNYFQKELKTMFHVINGKSMNMDLLQLYLDELAWRELYSKDPVSVLDGIHRCIFSTIYNDSDTECNKEDATEKFNFNFGIDPMELEQLIQDVEGDDEWHNVFPDWSEPSPQNTPANQEKSSNKVCDLCGKTFSSKGNLLHHRQTAKIHTGKRIFKCDLTGKRIFKCDLCGKSFSSMYNMKRHRHRTAHPIQESVSTQSVTLQRDPGLSTSVEHGPGLSIPVRDLPVQCEPRLSMSVEHEPGLLPSVEHEPGPSVSSQNQNITSNKRQLVAFSEAADGLIFGTESFITQKTEPLYEVSLPLQEVSVRLEKLSDDVIKSYASKEADFVSDGNEMDEDVYDKDETVEDVSVRDQGTVEDSPEVITLSTPSGQKRIISNFIFTSSPENRDPLKTNLTGTLLSIQDLLSVRVNFPKEKCVLEYNEFMADRLGKMLKDEGFFQDPVRWLARRCFVKKELKCQKCSDVASLEVFALHTDGDVWICKNPVCETTYAFKRPPFFVSNLKLVIIFLIIYHWAAHSDHGFITRAVPANEEDILDVYQRLRKVCGEIMKRSSFRLGGSGSLVEVGFFKFADCYIFGALDRESKNSRFYVACESEVDMHSIRDQLIPWFKEGSIIIVDYNEKLCWDYLKEKIRLEFSDETIKDPRSEKYHTLNITNYVINHLSAMFKYVDKEKMRNIPSDLLQLYLDELAWRQQCEKNPIDVFFSMFNCIFSLSYPDKPYLSDGGLITDCANELLKVTPSKRNDFNINKDVNKENISDNGMTEAVSNWDGAPDSLVEEFELARPIKKEVISDRETSTSVADSTSVSPTILSDFELTKDIKKEVFSDDEMSELVPDSVDLPSSPSNHNFISTKDIKEEIVSDDSNSLSTPLHESESLINTDVSISDFRTSPPVTESNNLFTSLSTQSSLSQSYKKCNRMRKADHPVEKYPYCIECNEQFSTTITPLNQHYYHFKKKYVCGDCKNNAFTTNCPRAFARHRVNILFKKRFYYLHDMPFKKDHSKLNQVWYCSCGFSSIEGNELASHLVECQKSTCYSNVKDTL